MSLANKIFSNTFWQLAIRAVNIIIGVFSLALITRLLGQAGFGLYTTIVAFVQIVAILLDLGLYMTLLREISSVNDRFSENRIINNIFTIRLLFSLLMLLLIPLAVSLFPYQDEVKTGVIYFMGTFFFQSLISTLSAVFSKKLAMPKIAIVDLVNKLAYLAFLLYFFFFGATLNQILWTNALTTGLAFLLLLFFLRHYNQLALAWDFSYWRQVFHRTWPLALTVVLNLLYFKADTLVLSAYHSPAAVGLYGAPYRVLEVVATFPHMFMSLILPFFTGYFVSQKARELNQVFQHSFNFFSIVSVAMIASVFLVSRPLMVFLAGEQFALSGPLLDILILATAGIFFGTLFTYLIVAIGAQKQMIKYFLIVAIVGIVGYFIFIPPYSYWGAAYMTLVVEWLLVFFAYWVVKKNIRLAVNFVVTGKSILAGLISFLLIYFFDINLLIKLGLFFLGYGLCLYLLKTVSRQDLRQIFLTKQA
ncbi:MAG: flippase [Patescibacteria group bacterium]|nr:flippase [Patescibacteria group bacterium]